MPAPGTTSATHSWKPGKRKKPWPATRRLPDWRLPTRDIVMLGRYPHRARFGAPAPDDRAAVARALDAGTVWINTYKQFSIATPFGGMKHSGYGREKAFEGLKSFTTIKTVAISHG